MRSFLCLVLMVYKLVSELTLIADEIMPVFGIDGLQACVRVDIDSWMRSCLCLALMVYKLVSV